MEWGRSQLGVLELRALVGQPHQLRTLAGRRALVWSPEQEQNLVLTGREVFPSLRSPLRFMAKCPQKPCYMLTVWGLDSSLGCVAMTVTRCEHSEAGARPQSDPGGGLETRSSVCRAIRACPKGVRGPGLVLRNSPAGENVSLG